MYYIINQVDIFGTNRILRKARLESTANTELKRRFWWARLHWMIKEKLIPPPPRKWPCWNGFLSSPASNGWRSLLNAEVLTISPFSSKVLQSSLRPSVTLLRVRSLAFFFSKISYHFRSHLNFNVRNRLTSFQWSGAGFSVTNASFQRKSSLNQSNVPHWNNVNENIKQQHWIELIISPSLLLWVYAIESTVYIICWSTKLIRWHSRYSSIKLWISAETLHNARLSSSGPGSKSAQSSSNMDPRRQIESRRTGTSIGTDRIAGGAKSAQSGNDPNITSPPRSSNRNGYGYRWMTYICFDLFSECVDKNVWWVTYAGDNLQTAVTVAKECVMIDPLLRLIQVEASLITASAEKRKQLQVIFKDPLSTPKFINPFNRSVRPSSNPNWWNIWHNPNCLIHSQMEGLVDVHSGSYCFVLDGNTFECLRSYNPPLLERIVHRAKVFARMAPEDKQHLIEILQKIGYRFTIDFNLWQNTMNQHLNQSTNH